jgi:hypothetical protein
MLSLDRLAPPHRRLPCLLHVVLLHALSLPPQGQSIGMLGPTFLDQLCLVHPLALHRLRHTLNIGHARDARQHARHTRHARPNAADGRGAKHHAARPLGRALVDTTEIAY